MLPSHIYIGIDPGKNGGVCVIADEEDFFSVKTCSLTKPENCIHLLEDETTPLPKGSVTCAVEKLTGWQR